MPRQRLPIESHLARLQALAPAQRRLLVASALWLPLFWLALHALGLTHLRAMVLRAKKSQGTTDIGPLQIQSITEMVGTAARHSPFPASCLTRSLLLEWLLLRRGVECRLRIGVRLEQTALQAHAWVEREGVPVNDRADIASRFAPFETLVPPSAFLTP